jgi:hypothetical protein
MTFNRYENGFDKCDSPICEEDVQIDILDITCTKSKKLYLEWYINDIKSRDLSNRLKLNQVLWSNNKSFDNINFSITESEPYRAEIDISNLSGLVYLKIKIQIDSTFFESDEKVFSISSCGGGEDIILAHWCGSCPDKSNSPLEFNLYVKDKAIPYRPVYFEYNNQCFFINDTDNFFSESSIASGTIIDNIGNVQADCSSCCKQINCPSIWEELPSTAQSFSGERIGTYYFEYQTYSCSNNIYIIRNFNENEDCDSIPEDRVIFNTGCVGTSYGQGGDFFVNDPSCIGINALTKGFCVSIRESYFPIGVINDCECVKGCTAQWRICAITPDGETLSWNGGNECLCDSISLSS